MPSPDPNLQPPSFNLQPAASRADLLALLDRLEIAHRTVEHPAVFTVEESRDLNAQWPGGHSKNLFLKDKADRLTLAIAWAETRVDLIGLGKRLKSKGRLSFGSGELMTATLGVIPGAVTPFALMNETAKALGTLVVDRALLVHDPVWFHPLENTASTAVSPGDLLKFLVQCGFSPLILRLKSPLDE